jgi:hypothetical protein
MTGQTLPTVLALLISLERYQVALPALLLCSCTRGSQPPPCSTSPSLFFLPSTLRPLHPGKLSGCRPGRGGESEGRGGQREQTTALGMRLWTPVCLDGTCRGWGREDGMALDVRVVSIGLPTLEITPNKEQSNGLSTAIQKPCKECQ